MYRSLVTLFAAVRCAAGHFQPLEIQSLAQVVEKKQ